MEAEKIFCLGDGCSRSTELAALLNNNGFNNNPFAWIVLLAMFGRNGMLGGNGEGVNCDLNRISTQLSDNQNSNLLMDAIKGNSGALRDLATNLNCDFNSLNSAVCGVRNGITEISGKIGISGERVINSVLLGNKDLVAALKDCCCQTQQNIIKGNYENQIATLNQTTQLQERMTNIANGIQQGFSAVAYESQKQTCDIINAGNANTQRIIDVMNNHWQAELAQKYQDARLELSQKAQNEYLIAQLRPATT